MISQVFMSPKKSRYVGDSTGSSRDKDTTTSGIVSIFRKAPPGRMADFLIQAAPDLPFLPFWQDEWQDSDLSSPENWFPANLAG